MDAETILKESEDVLEKRKQKIIDKIKNHFKSPYDIGALIIIVLSAMFRYYLLFKSKGQALWFDEGSYLLMARNWALGTPSYPEPVRDYLVSLIWTPLIKLGIGEFGLRFLTVTVGIVSFYFLYLLVSYFFGKKTGLISLVLTSFFYEHIFWSLRLEVGTYSIFFMLISLVCFFKAIKKNKTLFYVLAAAFAVFSLQAHAAGIFVCLVYVVLFPLYTKFKFYKSKKFWIFVLAFILILSPFLIRNFISFNQIYPRFQEGWFERQGEGTSFSGSLVYATTTPGLIGTLTFVLFLIGLLISLDVFLVLDKFFKNRLSKKNLGKIFFILFGLISLALGIQSLMGPGGAYFEPRYIIPYYFATLIFAGIGVNFISDKIKKHSKILAIAFIIIFLVFASYGQMKTTSDLVNAKKDSYQGIRQAGTWFKDNVADNAIIITPEGPQITYYSGKKVISYPGSNEEIIEKMKVEKPTHLLVWSGWGGERLNQIMNLINEYSEDIIPIGNFPSTYSQPTVGVYEIQDSFYG